MNPVVEAAWIAASASAVALGGSVLVAVTGFRNTRKATEVTIEGERRQRFDERQAAAYEDAVAEVLLRSTRREKIFSQGDIGRALPQLRDIRSRNEEPESLRVHGLLLAYASPAVREAYEAAVDADEQVGNALIVLVRANTIRETSAHWRAGEEDADTRPEPDYRDALAAVESAREIAVVKADAFVEAVREALPPGGLGGSRSVVKKERRPAR